MSNSLIPRVNELSELSEEQKDKVRRYVASGMTTHLSGEKEVGPFMLYMMGYSLEDVAKSSQFPLDVIALTAINSKWEEKRNLLASNGANTAVEMQKNMLNMSLVATFLAYKQELSDILSGKKEAVKSHLAIKSLSGIQNLVDMVMKMNGMVDAQGNLSAGGTVIHAQNVQINNNEVSEDVEKEKEKKQKARAELLKELANET